MSERDYWVEKIDFEPSSGCTEEKWACQRDIWVEIDFLTNWGFFEGNGCGKGTLR